MSAYSRIKWLHEQIMNNQYPSIKKLISHFEISYRQGQRDIEYMRDSLGAPIEYSLKSKGYFYSQAFSMPTMYLTIDEVDYMKKLSDYHNTLNEMGLSEHKKYGEMFNRISSTSISGKESKTQFQVPYTAKIKILGDRYSYRLLDKFLRGKTEDYFLFEFHNVELFIGLLLSCGGDFTILFPNWLRQRIIEICDKTIKNN